MRNQFLLLGLLVSMPVCSATFCVADGAALNAALSASAGNNESDSIRLQPGVFVHANGFQLTVPAGESIDLSGGWNTGPDPCTVLTPDASLSTIDGQNVYPGVYLYLSAGSGNATVHNLTIERVTHNYVPSAALYVGPQLWQTEYQGNVLIERVIVTDSKAYYGIFAGSYGSARVRGSISANNNVHNAVALGVFGTQGASVVNSTVVGNISGASNGDAVHSYRFVEGTVSTFSNNILQENITGGVERDLSSPEFTDVWINNIIGRSLYALSNDSQGNIMSARASFISPVLRDYRLRGGSVGINAGFATPIGGLPVVDLFGKTRQFGAGVDLGAHESETLFHSGFE